MTDAVLDCPPWCRFHTAGPGVVWHRAVFGDVQLSALRAAQSTVHVVSVRRRRSRAPWQAQDLHLELARAGRLIHEANGPRSGKNDPAEREAAGYAATLAPA